MLNRPALERDERTCPACLSPFVGVNWTCSRLCSMRYWAEHGRALEAFPGVSVQAAGPIVRCKGKVCDNLLSTPESLKRGRCLPCFVLRAIMDQAKAEAKAARFRERRLRSFNVYERHAVQSKKKRAATYDSEPEEFDA